jgi:hypothetical protein
VGDQFGDAMLGDEAARARDQNLIAALRLRHRRCFASKAKGG